jgi:hypothetical protein
VERVGRVGRVGRAADDLIGIVRLLACISISHHARVTLTHLRRVRVYRKCKLQCCERGRTR